MKRLERSRTLRYRWLRVDGEDIPPEHIDELDEAAVSRINEMMRTGYVAGGLCTEVRIDDSDVCVAYRGWWSVADDEDGGTRSTT